jgi:hypothetical protein
MKIKIPEGWEDETGFHEVAAEINAAARYRRQMMWVRWITLLAGLVALALFARCV